MILSSLLCLVVALGSCRAAWNVTCDLDLEKIEEIVKYLPDECQQIYKEGPNSELYKSSFSESKTFQEFRNALQAYERKANSTPTGEAPEWDEKLRHQIYNATMLSECSANIVNSGDSLSEEEKTKQFYGCLLVKREEMIQLIPT